MTEMQKMEIATELDAVLGDAVSDSEFASLVDRVAAARSIQFR